MEFQGIAEKIIKSALKKGCDAAELFIKVNDGISAEAKEGKLEALESHKGFGLAVKIIRNNRTGFAFTTDIEDAEGTLIKALDGCEWAGKDENVDIADFSPASDVLIFDKKIRDVKENTIIHSALLLEEKALDFDKRIKKVRKAEVGQGVGKTMIFNSRGVNTTYESTYFSAHVMALARDSEGDSQIGWDYAGSRNLDEIDIDLIGAGASRKAIALLGSKRISAVKVPVILSEAVAVEFLEILSASLSAEAVQKRRSFLAGKSGKSVVSRIIDVIDDGTMSWRIGTKPVDDEGVATQKKTLISKGILRGYLHNTYTARKDQLRSTGNAVRYGVKNLPGVGVTNLYIRATGNKNRNDFTKSLSRGIVILCAMGVHTANPISGDFSIGISGLWVENGEVVYPVKEAVISGNILEMFSKIEDIGNDLKFYGNIGSPSLLLGAMDISA